MAFHPPIPLKMSEAPAATSTSTAVPVVNAPPASTGPVDATVHPADTTVNPPPVTPINTQPSRKEWFRYTCAEVAVDKGAAESMRSTPERLGLPVQRAVITTSSNLWDNGIVSLHSIVFTSTNNSSSRRPSLTAS